jgi:hypothetical protein
MTKFSDNQSPKLTMLESAAPSTPGSGLGFLYEKTDGKLYFKNDAGTETELTAAGAASTAVAHGCRVKRASGNVSVGNNTLTVITYDAEDFDTDTMHDNSTNPSRLTVPSISGVTTGLWHVWASGYTNATTRLDAMLRINSATNPASGTSIAFCTYYANNTVNGYSLATDYVMTAGDYFELFIRSTGATGQVTFDSQGSPLMGCHFVGKVT